MSNPGFADAHANLGNLLKELGQLDQALASTLKSLELKPDNPTALMNLGGIYKELAQLDQALASTLKSLELKPDNPTALMNLGGIYKELAQLDQALASTLKSLELKPDNPDAHMNLGGIYKELAQLDQALASTLKSLELKPDNPDALMNLGGIYQDLGNLDQALASTLKSLELKPDNPTALMNLGGIYKELAQLDQALASTLKSLELKPDNPTALMNLGGIYKELAQLDQALASTLKSLELKPDNPDALNNLKGFIDQLTLSSANALSLTKAYELLINLDNISHKKLSKIFTQSFLPTIQEAAQTDPIISSNNNALNNLAADWRLRKSLTLLIPPHQAIENFLTRLRKELLVLVANQKSIPKSLKSLAEALAMQSFLNEYVYAQSPEEEKLVEQLIDSASSHQETFNQNLAIIACYLPIYQLSFNQDWLENYPTATYESRTLIQTQLQEPQEEERIKATIETDSEISDSISIKVQDMYEENPYPRYRYADFTDKSLAKSISKAIEIESTKQNLQFSEALTSNHSRPKVLIAGCGTGNQVINASRYKNAQITAIDLSSSSLAYAIRKAKEYGMDNVDFRKMDLLAVAALDKIFDVIECGGVLHHMEDPSKGISALNKQLKPGGYIKLGLYSDIARQDIVIARNHIKQLRLKSTADSIREFRQQVLTGEFKDLASLPRFGRNFYSLSECRDLCFHVQEHRFTPEFLQELLDAEGLIFCGFMLPEAVKNNYQKQFPSDTYMTSLENWGDFEKQNPTTFRAMYQFWACKPS
ncbi:tetratricopeptide repeat protein [Prochlorococcus sp. MIT 0718]